MYICIQLSFLDLLLIDLPLKNSFIVPLFMVFPTHNFLVMAKVVAKNFNVGEFVNISAHQVDRFIDR